MSGVEQVMPPPSTTSNEEDIASAVPHYIEVLRPYFQKLRPAYIYERLCLGNSAAALLSAEFRIPYIVEYNGSEVSMRRSFENAAYVYEAEYLEAEALAFEQATLISVVSAEIRIRYRPRRRSRKDPGESCGVDLDAYAQPAGWRDDRTSIDSRRPTMIGFTGTFGGWHGIDVLSEAIPRISKNDPRGSSC
jgi:glycosyltransferase involved in cell wall biosynthesis